MHNYRTFTIQHLKQPVQYDLDANLLRLDDGLVNANTPEGALSQNANPIRVSINATTTDPKYREVWLAAIPQINEFRAKEGLLPINENGETTPMQNTISENGNLTSGDVFHEEENIYDLTSVPTAFPPTGHTPQAPPPQPVGVPYETVIAQLKLTNTLLYNFLQKHVKSDDPDWIIIENLKDTCLDE